MIATPRTSPPATPVGPYVTIGADNAIHCGPCVIGGKITTGPELARRVAAALNATSHMTTEEIEWLRNVRPYQRTAVVACGVGKAATPLGCRGDGTSLAAGRRGDEEATPPEGEPVRPPAPLVTVGDADDDDRHL